MAPEKFSTWVKAFHRAGGKHCSCQVQKVQCRFLQSVLCSSVGGVNLASSFPGILLPCFFFLSRAARVVGIFPWSPVSWQGRSTPVSDGSNGRCGRQRAQQGATPFSTAQATRMLRVAVLSSVTIAAPSPLPVTHGTRSLPPVSPVGRSVASRQIPLIQTESIQA